MPHNLGFLNDLLKYVSQYMDICKTRNLYMDSNSLCIQVLILFISRPASITFFQKVACSLVVLLIHLSYSLVAGALNFPSFFFPVSRCRHWPITQNKNKSLQTSGHLKVKKYLLSLWPLSLFQV